MSKPRLLANLSSGNFKAVQEREEEEDNESMM